MTLCNLASSLATVCGTFFDLGGELSGLPYGGVLGSSRLLLEPLHAALIGTVCPISNSSGPQISSRERGCCTGLKTSDAKVIFRAFGTADTVQCSDRRGACRNTPSLLLLLLVVELLLIKEGDLMVYDDSLLKAPPGESIGAEIVLTSKRRRSWEKAGLLEW
jgi:hypothetical protein